MSQIFHRIWPLDTIKTWYFCLLCNNSIDILIILLNTISEFGKYIKMKHGNLFPSSLSVFALQKHWLNNIIIYEYYIIYSAIRIFCSQGFLLSKNLFHSIAAMELYSCGEFLEGNYLISQLWFGMTMRLQIVEKL